MPRLRLSLAVPTEPRSASSLDKDASLQNCFIDSDPNTNTLFAVKRPGFVVGSGAITTGLNTGIYVNPNNPVGGGGPDQTEVWYVDDTGTLVSFLADKPTPPSKNFSFNLNVLLYANLHPISRVREGTTDNTNCIYFEYNMNSGGVIFFLRQYVNSVIMGNTSHVELSPTLGTFFMEVKLEAGNYNLYRDGIVICSIASSHADWSNTALSQEDLHPTNAYVSDLQYE